MSKRFAVPIAILIVGFAFYLVIQQFRAPALWNQRGRPVRVTISALVQYPYSEALRGFTKTPLSVISRARATLPLQVQSVTIPAESPASGVVTLIASGEVRPAGEVYVDSLPLKTGADVTLEGSSFSVRAVVSRVLTAEE